MAHEEREEPWVLYGDKNFRRAADDLMAALGATANTAAYARVLGILRNIYYCGRCRGTYEESGGARC